MSGAEPRSGALIGREVRRREDQYLLRGQTRFLDDLPEPRGTVHLGLVGSPHAHAEIVAIDASEALALPGVIEVLTGADLAATIRPLAPDIEIAGYREARRPVVAVDRVRFVGETVAVVLAESRYLAEDAVERVRVEYRPLPVAASIEAALAEGAPLVHEALGDNVLYRGRFETEGFEERLAAARHVLEEEFNTGRVLGAPLEPRGCLALPDPMADTVTLWTTTQIPHIVRTALADHLGIPESKLRVAVPAVGGGFGTKAQVYPEELIVVALARRQRRAIKWLQDRREELLTDAHARRHRYRIRVAFDEAGVIEAVDLDLTTDAGAYSTCPFACTLESTGGARMLPGPYRIRHYRYRVRAVATHTTPTGAYRGTGQPSAFLAIEGMMDRIGRALGIDPAEVRRRNVVRPEEFPYVNVVGVRYDTGSYLESLERALELAGYEAYRAAQPADRMVDGKYRGIGICNFTEVSGTGAPGWRVRGFAKMPGFDSALVRVEPDGRVTVYLSQADAGQGHYTTFAQIAAECLGTAWEDVTVLEGDTGMTPYGTGTFASRGSVVGGGSIIRACEKVAAKMRAIAAAMLQARPEELVLEGGRVRVAGPGGASLTFREVAETAYSMNNLALPEGLEHGLEATDYYDPPLVTLANGAHVVQVAVDPEDGRVEIERYVAVHDSGRIINPLIAAGQVLGAAAQGIGEALMEEIVFDEHGQHLNATLLDYLLPTTLDVPDIDIDHIESPSIDAVGGFKGVGEGALTGAVPAVANAVADALAGIGARIARVPLRPEEVLAAIRRARAAQPGAGPGR